ncbi:MAG: D-serine deaminase-like pyridoxal phosphate-dependent protein [Planctomycetota bacterium]|jgi:D-serine deaminase-like pyridoxal phosphate-dependent protein
MTSFASVDPDTYTPDHELQARLLTPALAIHLDLVRANVRRILAHLEGDANRWRPHIKTTKLPVVWEILAEEGVRNFKCATTRELDVLLRTLRDAGVADVDVLVAYPHRQPALERLAQIAKANPEARVSVLIEDKDLVGEVPESISLFLDLNSGMNRTGIPPQEEATILELARSAGPRYRGLHWYDGHLHADNLYLRRNAVLEGLAKAAALLDRIEDVAKLQTEEVISSGTPAFLSSLGGTPIDDCPGTIHRLSPGTVVFHDLRTQIENKALGLQPAAVLLTRVISHPGEGLITCDAGSKSLAAEAETPLCEVLGFPQLEPLRPSEEHLPLRVKDGPRPARGTLLALVPQHICPTVNLAEEVLLFDAGQYSGSAKVEARARELLLPEE